METVTENSHLLQGEFGMSVILIIKAVTVIMRV